MNRMNMNDTTMTGLMGFDEQGLQSMAKPLDLQRLESSLNIEPFTAYAQEILSQPLSSSEDSDSDINGDIFGPDTKIMNSDMTTKCGNFE